MTVYIWNGSTGYNPCLGNVVHGKELDYLPEDQFKKLLNSKSICKKVEITEDDEIIEPLMVQIEEEEEDGEED